MFIGRIRNIRSIMTSNSKLNKVIEDLQTNPYFDKYAGKIAKMQKTAPEQFMEKIEQKHAEIEERKKELEKSTRRYTSLSQPKQAVPEPKASVSEKKLNDILKLDLVKDKEAKEIEAIWLKYHENKEVITASIPSSLYDKIRERVKKYPTFLFPLPRSQGYEFIMSQCVGHEVHFTTLLCYQVHKENAPECLKVVHYKDLAEDKGIVLMRGDYDKNVINAKEAQCIANQFQMYYGQDHPVKFQLLDDFTNKPVNFKHMDLITEFENIKLG